MSIENIIVTSPPPDWCPPLPVQPQQRGYLRKLFKEREGLEEAEEIRTIVNEWIAEGILCEPLAGWAIMALQGIKRPAA